MGLLPVNFPTLFAEQSRRATHRPPDSGIGTDCGRRAFLSTLAYRQAEATRDIRQLMFLVPYRPDAPMTDGVLNLPCAAWLVRRPVSSGRPV